MRYDHGRENLDQNAVNFLGYDEEAEGGSSANVILLAKSGRCR
jgi:hypothetical protein